MKSSTFKLAPPTNPPSISVVLNNSFAFEGFTQPPYCILMFSATSLLYNPSTTLLINLQASFASSDEAVFPVPIAQTGSYAITKLLASFASISFRAPFVCVS